MTDENSPARRLQGLTLDGGWVIGDRIELPSKATGGNFSCGYKVKHPDGTEAFLKAMDYSRALRSPDPARALQVLTESFNFERDMVERCRARNLDHVVRAIADGMILVPDAGGGQVVQYLIFELAERDVRAQLDITGRYDISWVMTTLRQIGVGLKQLHSIGIAHQDLKPSNVLVFQGSRQSKLGDLGHSACSEVASPRDDNPVTGDPVYAPLEQCYRYVDPDWNRRRRGCDAYLLGSMVVYFFTGVSMTTLLAKHLHKDFWPQNWTHGFAEVLPYLREAFAAALQEFKESVPNAQLADKLVGAVRQLCEPDPKYRGHPLERKGEGNSFSLERYISLFDLLAHRARVGRFGR